MQRRLSIFQRVTASLLTFSLVAAFFATAAQAQTSPAVVLNNLPLRANVLVVLKNKQKLHGARGVVTDAGFTLPDSKAGARQLTFDEVSMVRAEVHKSHTARNILIGVGIGLAGVTITFAVLVSRL